MRPEVRVEVDGADASAALYERLIELEVEDALGLRSDRVRLTLDDRPPAIAWPEAGAALRVSLGYSGGLYAMGAFVVDEVVASAPPARLVLTGRATPYGEAQAQGWTPALKEHRQRAWEQTTLGRVLADVAGDVGLEASVHPDVASVALDRVEQWQESDLHLLERLARDFDLTVKVAGGTLVAVPGEGGVSASAIPIGAVRLRPADVSRWELRTAVRTAYGAVRVGWDDRAAGQTVELTVGTDGPTYTLRKVYPTEAEARRAAEARLRGLNRRRAELRLTLPGDGRLAAGGTLELEGFRPEVDGRWTARRVTHRIGASGFVTELEATP